MRTLSKSLTLLLFCLFALTGFAQDCVSERYKEQVFPNIKVTKNIKFGEAWGVTDIFGPQDLELDFYEPDPADEYLGERPLVIMLFGGAFVLGDKGDADVSAWCDSLAHYGYACASVNYRLDNLINIVLGEAQGTRAAYRAIQDARSAIRFLLEDPNNRGFNIARDYIYTGGESAGAIAAVHVAYLEDSERPQATYAGGLFSDLGCIDCSGNNYNQAFNVKGIIDLWGATLQEDFLDANENVPMLIIHGDADLIVPYTSGKPFSDIIQSFPYVYGAIPMDAKLTANGTYHEFYTYAGQGHIFYGLPTGIVTFPNQFWEPIWNQGHNFLYTTMQYASPTPQGNMDVCLGETTTYTVPQTPGSAYCWEVTGGTIVADNGNTITVNWTSTNAQTIGLTEENYIDVIGSQTTLTVDVYAPTPDFQFNSLGNAVTFEDLSMGAVTWDWDFGDGTTSTDQNPSHTFGIGSFPVTLTVTDAFGCSQSYTEILVFTPLPVELISFTGVLVNDDILLEWKTETEINSEYFTLEKSTNALDFYPIANLPAAGNSSSPRSYDYLDRQAVKGANYYRLKQVDFDGTFTYSHVVEVEFDKEVRFTIKTLLPVPQVGLMLDVVFTSNEDATIQAVIYDVLGRKVFEENIEAAYGTNQVRLTTGELASGVYVVQLKKGLQASSRKFLAR